MSKLDAPIGADERYPTAVTVDDFRHNLASVESRIAEAARRAGRDPREVTLLPVSKTVPTERVRVAIRSGMRLLGENKVQEAVRKNGETADLDVSWSIIGHLQTNKARDVAAFATEFQALDRLRVAEALDRRLQAAGRSLDVFVQVNTSAEDSKFGMPPEELPAFLEALPSYGTLRVRGLMTLAILTPDDARVRECFSLLRTLRDQARQDAPDLIGAGELSMGMSGDYEIAVEEGATCVRVGQAIFGARALPDSHYWPEGGRHVLRTVRAYLELTKPRILELLLVTTIPVMVFAADGRPDIALLGAVLVGGALSAGSAGAFNMYFERESDAVMERTARRPLVTGVVSARAGLIFATVLGISSVGWMLTFVGPLPAALSTAGLVLYVVFYTLLLKRRTEQNIVWGGVAGCMPVLVGWTAVRGALEWPAVILFLVVFFWTPAHYWPLSIRYRDDYRRAGLPMLGATRPPSFVAIRVIGFAVLTVVCSLILPFVAEVSLLYWTVALGAGAGFVVSASLMRSRARRGGELRPMLVFRASIVYLAALFLAVGVDPLLTP